MAATDGHRRDSAVSDSLLKPRSRALTDGASRAGARSMLRACGLKDDDFNKPLIGVANTWIEIGPCNYHLRELAQHVKDGIRAAVGTLLAFDCFLRVSELVVFIAGTWLTPRMLVLVSFPST